jgi:MFS family permease
MIFTHIVAHGTDIGILAMEAAAILSLIGVMNIPGRLLVGRMSDSVGRKPTAITCALFVAGAIIWLIYSKDLWMFYLFAVVFGFFFGGFDASTTALIGDVFGLRSIGIIMGTLSAGFGLGAALGPFIGGLVYDVSKNYFVAFSICAAAMIMVTLLFALIKRGNEP